MGNGVEYRRCTNACEPINMTLSEWDTIEVILAECIYAHGYSPREAVLLACQMNPDCSVEYLVLALASVCFALEQEWQNGGEPELRRLVQVYQSLAAVSSDVACTEIVGERAKSCGDLLKHWQLQADGYFV